LDKKDKKCVCFVPFFVPFLGKVWYNLKKAEEGSYYAPLKNSVTRLAESVTKM
jgi:hypothetical protein